MTRLGPGTRTNVRPGPARSGRLLARREDGAVAVEGEAPGGCLREVVLATGHVGPTVDDAHADGPAAVTQRQLRAAGQRLVRHAEAGVGEPAAAAQTVAVQARPVPRRMGIAEGVQPTDPLARP